MKDFGLLGGICALIGGAPGTGKSHLLGSIVEVAGVEKAILLAPKPREVNSYKYVAHRDRIDAEVFRDNKWAPPAGSFEAGAYTQLYKRVLSLYDDTTYDAVILDPYTDVTHLAAHELMAVEKAATPRDLRDSIGFYGSLAYKLKDFTQSLTGLASPALKRPKHVLVAVHLQPTKEDQQLGKNAGGGTKESSDNRAQGVEFFGDALPMIEGRYRREIAAEFDILGKSVVMHGLEDYVKPEGGKAKRQATQYVVQLGADPEFHAKAAIIPKLDVKHVPNTMPAIFKVIEEALAGASR
jgi:extradiol dioxygenase family protein